MQQSAEEIAPLDLGRVEDPCARRICCAAAVRRPEFKGAVWTLLVEVADVDAEDVFELAAAEDQQPVKALPACASDQRSA